MADVLAALGLEEHEVALRLAGATSLEELRAMSKAQLREAGLPLGARLTILDLFAEMNTAGV